MVGMTCGRTSPATATRRATGHRGWESGLGWGCYRQATANRVSKRRPNFHHQLPSTKAVPYVGNDKGFRVATGWLPDGLRVAVSRLGKELILHPPTDLSISTVALARWKDASPGANCFNSLPSSARRLQDSGHSHHRAKATVLMREPEVGRIMFSVGPCS